MPSEPPPTIEQQKAWAMQWKSAGRRLQEVRDRELRELDQSTMLRESAESPEENGLVTFQRWMMRLALLKAYGDRVE